MIATLALYAFGFVVLVIACYAIALAFVELLDRVGLVYDPSREDGTVPFPAELLEEGHVIRRRPVAVGPGRRVTIHDVAHAQETHR